MPTHKPAHDARETTEVRLFSTHDHPAHGQVVVAPVAEELRDAVGVLPVPAVLVAVVGGEAVVRGSRAAAGVGLQVWARYERAYRPGGQAWYEDTGVRQTL